MLSVQEIEDRLCLGHEVRGLELKGPGARSDGHFLAKIVRACLGMGNLRDGGHVVIGINDKDPASLGPGLDDTQLKTWSNPDHIARDFATYADPPMRFDRAIVELSTGARLVVLEVHEFSDVPHLCAKDYPKVLRDGALYVRPRKVTETSEVATSVDMRDVLDLATEKRLRDFVERAHRAGVTLTVHSSGPTDAAQFADQLQQGWS